MAVLSKNKTISFLKQFRSILLIGSSLAFLLLVFDRILGMLTLNSALIVIAISIGLLLLGFAIQGIVVLLVGQPLQWVERQKHSTTPNYPSMLFENVSLQDWLGANPWRRLASWSPYMVIWYYILLFQSTSNPLLLWLFPLFFVSFSLGYAISKITFEPNGIRFESSLHSKWGIGRSYFINYLDISIRQPTMFGGAGTTILEKGRRRYFVNAGTWQMDNYRTIITQLLKRIPQENCDLFQVYNN